MSLQEIKNNYAKTKHYGHWNELLLNNDSFTVGNLHLNEVMKIYAMECLKLASLNIDYKYTFLYNSVKNAGDEVAKQITNKNNIIK